MPSIYSSLFRPWQVAAGIAASLLIWASWNTPEMHHYVRPAATTVWQLTPVDSLTAQALAAQLATEPGVAACAVSPRTNCVAFVYHPDEVTPAALYEAVGRHGSRVLTTPSVNRVAPVMRQCPVPAGYLVWLDQVRFALNLRRFFISV